MFYGYRYNENDQYHGKEELHDAQAVWDYVQLHKLTHPEIKITDDVESIIVSARNGWIDFPKQWVLQEIQEVFIMAASPFDSAAFMEAMFRAGFDIRGAQPSTSHEASELLERVYSSLPQNISRFQNML